MKLLFDRLRKHAPWAFPVAGALIVAQTILAWASGFARSEFVRTNHYGIEAWGTAFSRHSVDKVIEQARAQGLGAALAAVDVLHRSRAHVDGADRLAELLRTRLRIQFGNAPDGDLDAFLGERENFGNWAMALEQRLQLFRWRGDAEGREAFLRRLLRGSLRHPVQREFPFPYVEHDAALDLAKLALERGDPRGVRAWVGRLRGDLAVDYPSFCGDPLRGELEVQDRLLKAAAVHDGADCSRTPYDRAAWVRRLYGPTWDDGLLRILGGVLLAAAGGLAPLARHLPVPWSFFWRRRGRWARFGLGTYVLGFAMSLWLAARPLLDGPYPPPDSRLLLLGVLSLGYTAVFIPFVGCFIAEEDKATGLICPR